MNDTARRVWVLRLGMVLLIAAVGVPCSAAARDPARAARKAGRLIVRERAGLTADAMHDVLRRTGARRVGALDAVGAAVVEAPERELATVERSLRRSGLFSSVERDYLVQVAEEPNDTYYGVQWGLGRIAAPDAWDLSSGDGVIVAVIDTGIEAGHPDLQGAALPGYDFVNGDDDPADDHGHGTRMSGIIVAQRDNGIGIAGAAPGATLLPVKVLDWEGHGTYSDVANGITYAVDQGARVLNLSLVGTVASDILQAAVTYATAKGAIVVAAAGNYGSSAPAFPAAADGAIAVSAIDESDAHPAFSNYGPWIALSAPGVDIATTSLDGGYDTSTGTSPAAAFGSAVFALLLADEPTLSRGAAIERVRKGTVDIGKSGWDRFFGWGRADAYGALVPGQHGGTAPDESGPDVGILSPAVGSLMSGMVPVDVAANDDVAVARVELFVDDRWYATATTPPYRFVVDASRFAPGQHTLRAYAYDMNENEGRTRGHKILLTSGTGLLVGRAVARASKVTISADFALPAASVFDPARDSLAITLTSEDGTVLAATALAGSLIGNSTGRMKGTVAPIVPSSGSVRLSAKGGSEQAIYSLKVKATQLEGMDRLDALMNLSVRVGDVQLSQSLSFREKGTTLLYP